MWNISSVGFTLLTPENFSKNTKWFFGQSQNQSSSCVSTSQPAYVHHANTRHPFFGSVCSLSLAWATTTGKLLGLNEKVALSVFSKGTTPDSGIEPATFQLPAGGHQQNQ